MACASFIPPGLFFPPRPYPSPSPIPSAAIPLLFQSRKLPHIRLSSHRRPDAYPTSHTLQSTSGGHPGGPEPPPGSKKKKKRKPRPSFYDQALERWSVRISSQRSRFPWQEERAARVEEALESGGGAVNRRLGLIVEKLNESLNHSSLDCKDSEEIKSLDSSENSSMRKPFGGRLGVMVAPWVHGTRPRETHFDADASANTGDERSREAANMADEQKRGDLMIKKPDGISYSTPDTPLANSSDQETPPVEWNPVGNGAFKTIEENTEFSGESSSVSFIVEELKSSLEQDGANQDDALSFSDSDKEQGPNSCQNVAKLTSAVPFPWERDRGSDEERLHKRSNTELAERTIPEPELRRLRNVALRMKERMTVSAAGVTEGIVESIRKKWREAEVVKIRFEGPPSLNMKRTHEMLESKTGGLVIWRSGRSVVLYRGMIYELPCAQSYSKLASANSNENDNSPSNGYTADIAGNSMNDIVAVSNTSNAEPMASFVNLSKGLIDTSEIDKLLDGLGPRFKDWSGCNPLPVDADLLPGVVPGYNPPYRLLPYKTRSALRNREMTSLRRVARSMPPHFALGRNRQHQGLAKAIVKLWEKSAVAKIAIKRGVPNTCNERMAEEIKKLTGGTLLSRNKDYIVFYRGNDFLIPSIREALVEKQKLATVKQDQEELARLRGSAIFLNPKQTKGPLVAGTFAETVEAKARWGDQPSHEDREKMRRELAVANQASLVRYLERKLAFAKAKVRKAEKALAKVQEFLQPAELPTDLETVTDEERFLYRKMGLKMRAFLLLGRRGVFDGTVQNMHLSWKHRELIKILVKHKSFAQVKHIAVSLEAESGGVLISLDKTTKGYAIIIYRGKNYHRPQMLRPGNLLTRRQALTRSIELQRREALNHHIENLREKIQLMKSRLDQMEADKELGSKDLDLQIDKAFLSDDDMEDEGEEAYLETYNCSDDE